MRDINNVEIQPGDNIVYVRGGSSPYLKLAHVLEVQDDKIQAMVYGSWNDSPKPIWLRTPRHIAVYRDPIT